MLSDDEIIREINGVDNAASLSIPARSVGAAKPPGRTLEYASAVPAASDDGYRRLARAVLPPMSRPLNYCPVCGSDRPPVKKSKGNLLALVLLLMLGVLPGLIYAILNDGYVYKCPHCQTRRGEM